MYSAATNVNDARRAERLPGHTETEVTPMGKYQKNIEAARRITVMQYLETYHPGELVRKTDCEYLLKDIYKHEFLNWMELAHEP